MADWLPEADTNGHEPLVDENLKASLLRQGRSGHTHREGLRAKHFQSSADQFPVAHRWETWEDWSKRLMGYLTGTAYRVMHQDGITPSERLTIAELRGMRPRQEQVAETVLEITYAADEALTRYIRWDGPRGQHRGARLRRDRQDPTNDTHRFTGRVGYDVVERMAERAVFYAWDGWDSEYLSKRALMGRKGGQISKRRPEFTWEHVEPLLHLTKGQQAIRLGVSRKTITRIHQRHAASGDR
jgi:hypothetical protein